MPKLERVTPILAVRNVGASIAYYMEKLNFTSWWGWEQPPTFDGVRRDGIEIFFCQDSDTPHGLKPGGFSVLRGHQRSLSPKALPAPFYVSGGVVISVQAGSALRATMPADG